MHLHLGLIDITEGKRNFFVKTLWKMLTLDLHLWQNIWELARLREDKVVLSVLQLCMHRMCPVNTGLVHRTRRPMVQTLQVSARAHSCPVCSGRASPVVTGCVRCCTEQLHCPFFFQTACKLGLWTFTLTGPVRCAADWHTRLGFQRACKWGLSELKLTRPVRWAPDRASNSLQYPPASFLAIVIWPLGVSGADVRCTLDFTFGWDWSASSAFASSFLHLAALARCGGCWSSY